MKCPEQREVDKMNFIPPWCYEFGQIQQKKGAKTGRNGKKKKKTQLITLVEDSTVFS